MVTQGRAWKLGDNVDTDQLVPGRYLSLTDPQELASHCLEDVVLDFHKLAQPGDIVVAGENFGCGSSREHAPVAIKGIGISVVIAESFARIFHRNCVNTGLPILVLASTAGLNDGDVLEVDITNGRISNISTGESLQAETLSSLELEIMAAGGLLSYLKKCA
ncbi:MAG: 3-isopropylmalate dehydratase small subunit [Anaerolineae bacterium]|jgi:3-isopropylmalate/(R)-2-methylmalate dehydratase small subunit